MASLDIRWRKDNSRLARRTRDNTVVYIAKAFAHQALFFAAVDQVASSLPPEVAEVIATLGTDWAGESAVFFKVITKENAIPRPQLLAFTQQVSGAIVRQLSPLEEWGVLPYFRFLTQSEYSRVKEKEPAWA
jgi:hypothetical protein